MTYFNCNGKLLPSDSLVFGPDNRAVRYGEGLFETFKCINGNLILLDEHFSRLWKGLQLFQFEIPRLFTPDTLQKQVLDLLQKNRHTNSRIRINVTRGNGGLYEFNNTLHYTIQSWEFSYDDQLNENGLQAGIYRDVKKMTDSVANCKHNNFLPYSMGALFAKKNKYNDAIILNNYDRICESTIANVFLIKNNIIYTPSLSEGCVAGIIRKQIIRLLPDFPISVEETSITQAMLLDADEVFFTNSIYNIRWLSAIENKTYKNVLVKEIYAWLLQTNPVVFC